MSEIDSNNLDGRLVTWDGKMRDATPVENDDIFQKKIASYYVQDTCEEGGLAFSWDRK